VERQPGVHSRGETTLVKAEPVEVGPSEGGERLPTARDGSLGERQSHFERLGEPVGGIGTVSREPDASGVGSDAKIDRVLARRPAIDPANIERHRPVDRVVVDQLQLERPGVDDVARERLAVREVRERPGAADHADRTDAAEAR